MGSNICGLFGVVGSGINQQDLVALRTLGFVSELRGRHGTGVAQGRIFNNDLEVEIDKSNMDFAKHLDYNKETNFRTPNQRRILEGVRDNFFLCHVRHATVGNISPNNAHPYLFENVVGMHNGTLTTSEFVPDLKETVTDSYKLFDKMNKEGVDSALSSLSTLDAFALVFIDRNKSTINIIRNRQRTLFWAVSDKRSCLWIASEASFLNFINERHDLGLSIPKAFEVHDLYSFKPSDVVRGEEPKWSTEPRLFTYGRSEPTKYDWQMDSNLRYTPSYWRTEDQRSSPENKEKRLGEQKEERSDSNVIHLPARNDSPWSDYEERNGYSFDFPSDQDIKSLVNSFKPRLRELQGIAFCTSVRHIPERDCVVCGKSMSLYDAYLGSEFDEFEGLHQDCSERYSPETIVM